MMVTVDSLKQILDDRFGGVLRSGRHTIDGEACAFELLSAARDIPWTDNPIDVRSFDLRSLNDIYVSDTVRTEYLLPVIAAYDGSLDWPQERKQAVATQIIIGVVREIISNLPHLSDATREECRAATNLQSAQNAATRAAWNTGSLRANEGAAAADTADAAANAHLGVGDITAIAARATLTASTAYAHDARTRVFTTACRIWLEAAHKGESGA